MRIPIFLLLLASTTLMSAQTTRIIPLRFIPTYDRNHTLTQGIHLQDSSFYSNDKDSIEIRTLKFYISGIQLNMDSDIVWKETNSYHLIDASNEQSLSVPLTIPIGIDFKRIIFNLGIDSATNVMGVQGGDLDPMRGMYWTWQSGYINFKMEGNSPLCKTRHHAFEFHIGGYHCPYNTFQCVSLPDHKAKEGINIYILLKELLSTIDLARTNQIMTPGKEALWISKEVKKCFTTFLDVR